MDDPAEQSSPLITAPAIGASPWEMIPPGEAGAVAAITRAIEARVRAAAIGAPARRDAHPKSHGCVEAEFHVLGDLPPALRTGLFAQARRYQAWVRFSNGSGKPQNDAVGDGRGMAIKVMGVDHSPSGTQDFILINNPTFFVRDAADYVDFQAATNSLKFFFPGWNPFRFRLHELLIAQGITARSVSNPLNTRYWSMTPYLCGETPCKFSVRPGGPPSRFNDRSAPNFLHDNLARALAEGDAAFDFCVQLRGDPSAMPIEDPTIAWREADAVFTPVARIVIPRQGFDEPDRIAFGENLSFTPWHGLDAHRPLGGVNRVRRTVYETISRVRHELNHAPRAEPTSLPPLEPAAPPNVEPRRTSVADTLFDDLAGVVGGAIDACGWADSVLSKMVIDQLVGCAPNRPHPWSTASDYTSWKSLTDRTYQGRQLPVGPAVTTPPSAAVAALFTRPNGVQRPSDKSTCLFPAFAQYLTDGFIRTDAQHRDRTTSNHDIDLCPLYGLNEAQTLILRAQDNAPGRLGRLKSQMIDGEEYPPFLYLPGGVAVDPAFAGLNPPLMGPDGASAERLASLFAVGGDRANSTPFTAMMNTLFLREHNRIAGELEAQNAGWDDERVFQTARNIIIPIFIKIVVEQYINHITPLPFNLIADPSVAWTANWNRPNWITAEFSLLYRWHSLMPDAIDWPSGAIPLADFGLDNRPLISLGLGAAFAAAAAQPAADLGAFNTHPALMVVETLAVEQARFNRLQSYNHYRVQYGMPAAADFSDITSDASTEAALRALYPTPDDVEFYPGLFAEDRVAKSPLPGLLLRMVGVDAFSQALTNPLLSEHVFNADTFTPWGFDLIQNTKSLGDILLRQGAIADAKTITMTQPSWSYGWHIP